MLKPLLLQKRAREEECAALIQRAEEALKAKASKRQSAQGLLSALIAQQPALSLGRQKMQELQRSEASRRKIEEATITLRQLQLAEQEAQQALDKAHLAFTEAAQERKSIELALEAEQKQLDKQREKKQEEEREESWRTQRTQTGDR